LLQSTTSKENSFKIGKRKKGLLSKQMLKKTEGNLEFKFEKKLYLKFFRRQIGKENERKNL
jgi:hypothetical protein